MIKIISHMAFPVFGILLATLISPVDYIDPISIGVLFFTILMGFLSFEGYLKGNFTSSFALVSIFSIVVALFCGGSSLLFGGSGGILGNYLSEYFLIGFSVFVASSYILGAVWSAYFVFFTKSTSIDYERTSFLDVQEEEELH